MITIDRSVVTDAQKQQYNDQGYFILEGVIPDNDLEALRSECQRFIDRQDRQMDELGTDVLGISHRGRRYFINAYSESEKVRAFVRSPLMIDICRATIGETAYVAFEQYVVKSAEKGMKFAWHQDSGYIFFDHTPYLSCWCALDDVNEENGTVYVLPYDRAGTRHRVDHVREEGTNDLVGYFGDDPGIPVIAPAGSIAVFSSTMFHRSGANTTDQARRIYLAQYSPEIITDPKTGLGEKAYPLLKDGVIVPG